MAAPVCDPRVRVAALIKRGEDTLVVRHVKDGASYHLLPGGGVEAGEMLVAALEREVREETGLVCEVGDLLFVNDTIAPDGSRHVVQLTFEARETGSDPAGIVADARVAGVELLTPAELASADLRPPIAAFLHGSAPQGASYLGALWSEDPHGSTQAGVASE